MYRRTRAREVALQLLFQRDSNPGVDRSAIERFVNERLRDEQSRAYCLRIYDGVTGRAEEVDAQLTAAADNWRLPRMAATDRNVLRIGVFELIAAEPDTPAAVVIDEGIELAKRFGTVESASFVNGVLDRVRQVLVPNPTE